MANEVLLLERAAVMGRQRSGRMTQAVLGGGSTLAARCEGHKGLRLIPHGFIDHNPRQHERRLVLDGLLALLGSVGACTMYVCQHGCGYQATSRLCDSEGAEMSALE